MDNVYILVEWPDSQEFMEEEWFKDEAVLAQHDSIGSSAYFIPAERYLGFINKIITILGAVTPAV